MATSVQSRELRVESQGQLLGRLQPHGNTGAVKALRRVVAIRAIGAEILVVEITVRRGAPIVARYAPGPGGFGHLFIGTLIH
jgi:hypothetical protein